MKQSAIDAAVVEFNRAAQSMDDLAASNNFAEVERHWAAFLVSAGRVFTKLQQGSKAVRVWLGGDENFMSEKLTHFCDICGIHETRTNMAFKR